MNCEKCGDRGFTEQEHGLVRVFCDCAKGKELRVEVTGETPDVLATGWEDTTYTGIYFQLAGKRTDEFSDDELWKQCKEAVLEKMQFPYVLVMPCGFERTFVNQKDVTYLPVVDLPCPCGNPNHTIIKFSDQREVIDDSNSGTGQPDSNNGGDYSRKPKLARKSKAKKGARKKSG